MHKQKEFGLVFKLGLSHYCGISNALFNELITGSSNMLKEHAYLIKNEEKSVNIESLVKFILL